MTSALRRCIALVTAVGFAAFAGGACAQPFYAGKTVRMIINFEPGGAIDLEARLYAQHLGALIEGAPAIIAQNITGGGGMAGINTIGRGTKDGLIFGYVSGAGGKAAFEPQTFQGIPLSTFEIVAYLPGASIYYARTDVRPGLKTPADILKAENLFAGGLETGANKDLTIRITLDMLGVKHGYITGYKGTGPAKLAMQAGEISFFSDGRASYDTGIVPLVKEGMLIPIYYDSLWDGEKATVHKPNADLPVKPFHEFYREVKGVPPSGQLWDAYIALLAANAALQRVITLPPGTPKPAVDALRTATAKLNTHQDYVTTANKLLGFAPEYMTGPDVNERVQKMTTVAPEMRQFIVEYTERGRGQAPGKK